MYFSPNGAYHPLRVSYAPEGAIDHASQLNLQFSATCRVARTFAHRSRAGLPPNCGSTARTSLNVPVYEAELWTSRQRQASPIHEISYRACFKPQLPAYFIERLTREGDVVYDPFSGRGTTAIEAALRGRNVDRQRHQPAVGRS